MIVSVSKPLANRRFAILSSQAFSLSNFRGPLIRDVVARGWRVYAIAPDYNDETRAAVRRFGAEPIDCPLSRTGLNPASDLLYVFRLARLLRRLEVEVVLSYFMKPVIFGTIAAWLARVPSRFALIAGLGYVFISPEKGEQNWSRRALRYLASNLYRFALARTNRVFFQNADDLEEFTHLRLVDSARARNTLGTGVDLEEWSVAPAVTSPITFVLAARLLREKGIPEFAEAARRIKRSRPGTRFVLLGGLDSNPGGLSRNEVERWAEEGIIEWKGHVPVAPWLAQTSVYVLPSYYREGIPRSIQEAMAMGRAIITTDCVGCRETVEEGQNGFLVPARDVDALYAAMLRFVENPDLIERMGSASRRLVEQRFDVRRVNKLLLDEMKIS